MQLALLADALNDTPVAETPLCTHFIVRQHAVNALSYFVLAILSVRPSIHHICNLNAELHHNPLRVIFSFIYNKNLIYHWQSARRICATC